MTIRSQMSGWLMRIRPAFVASFLKRLIGTGREVIETSHGRFFVDPVSNLGNSILSERGFEPEMVETLCRLLRPGDTFVDLGANEGFFSVVASGIVGTRGRVVSIEPQSRLQPVIARNIKENQAFNVLPIQVAVSDRMGIADLYLLPDMNSGGSGFVRATRYKVPTEPVLQRTLSNIFALLMLTSVRLMKIDIEGYEYEAILGSREVFSAGLVEHIALELHPTILEKRGRAIDDISLFLEQCGYRRNEECRTLVFSLGRRNSG